MLPAVIAKARRRPGAIAFLVLLALGASAAPALAGGINVTSPVRICHKGTYETVRAGRSYFNVYNADGTCMTVNGKLSMGDIVVKRGTETSWQYPNISSGWQWGRSSCAGRSGQCYDYPVLLSQVLARHAPRSGMRATKGAGAYNLSWDTWFDPAPRTSGQDTGTELMIWLAHPGIGVASGRTWQVTIDGLRWKVSYWVASHNGTHWNYVRYALAAQKPGGVGGLWLNPFFRNAIAHGVLSSRYYLTSVDAGFEIPVRAGHVPAHGMSLSAYVLGGLPSSKGGVPPRP